MTPIIYTVVMKTASIETEIPNDFTSFKLVAFLEIII